MSTTRGQHGTRGMYVMGCRCELCRSANADDQWARKRLREWENNIVGKDGRIRGVSLFESGVDISAKLITESVEKYAKEIKIETLIQYRRLERKGKKCA